MSGRLRRARQLAARSPLALLEKLGWRAAEQAALAATRVGRALAPRSSPPFDVDAVVTWAGPDTPDRRAERAAFAVDVDGATEGIWRWADHDELRYALRSIYRCAPWLCRVHLVVADSPPPWLDPTHPWIQITTHRAIFPSPAHLPTFNASAIEAHLHRVPDLAERFLYLNDDMLLLSPAAPRDLVDSAGRVKVDMQWKAGRFPSGNPRPGDGLDVVRARNTARILEARYGRRPRLWPSIKRGCVAARPSR